MLSAPAVVPVHPKGAQVYEQLALWERGPSLSCWRPLQETSAFLGAPEGALKVPAQPYLLLPVLGLLPTRETPAPLSPVYTALAEGERGRATTLRQAAAVRCSHVGT